MNEAATALYQLIYNITSDDESKFIHPTIWFLDLWRFDRKTCSVRTFVFFAVVMFSTETNAGSKQESDQNTKRNSDIRSWLHFARSLVHFFRHCLLTKFLRIYRNAKKTGIPETKF
jgi:hypothetical protein